MKLMYMQTSRLLGKELQAEAARCVLVHGAKGKGDKFGSEHLEVCTAEYVQTCVDREVAANPTNELAVRLQGHFFNAMN